MSLLSNHTAIYLIKLFIFKCCALMIYTFINARKINRNFEHFKFFTIVLKLTPPNLQLLKVRFIWLNEQMNAAIIETVLSYIYDNNLLY